MTTSLESKLRFHKIPAGSPIAEIVLRQCGESFATSSAFVDGKKAIRVHGNGTECMVMQLDVGLWSVVWSEDGEVHEAQFRVNFVWERVPA